MIENGGKLPPLLSFMSRWRKMKSSQRNRFPVPYKNNQPDIPKLVNLNFYYKCNNFSISHRIRLSSPFCGVKCSNKICLGKMSWQK